MKIEVWQGVVVKYHGDLVDSCLCWSAEKPASTMKMVLAEGYWLGQHSGGMACVGAGQKSGADCSHCQSTRCWVTPNTQVDSLVTPVKHGSYLKISKVGVLPLRYFHISPASRLVG